MNVPTNGHGEDEEEEAKNCTHEMTKLDGERALNASSQCVKSHTQDYLLFHLFGVVSGGSRTTSDSRLCIQFDDLWPAVRHRNAETEIIPLFIWIFVERAEKREQNICDR